MRVETSSAYVGRAKKLSHPKSPLLLYFCITLVFFSAGATRLNGQAPSDWPEFLNTNMERWNPYETVINANNVANLGINWTYAALNEGAPVVANGTVYIGAVDDNVYALNASTGAKLWNYATGGYVFSSPAVANGVVYVGSEDGNVYALDASTGAKLWSYRTGGGVSSSPAVANGVVYVGSEDFNVYALNAGTGAKLWSYLTGSYVFSSPAVASGTVYVGSADGNVYALDASTGAKLWNYTAGQRVDSSPAVANGVVYVGSDNGNVYALNASTGTKLWNYATGGWVLSAVAVANGVIYIGSRDNNLYALNASTGVKLWNYTAGAYVQSSAAVANGVVYVGSDNGNVYALDASTGAKLWSYTTGGSVLSSPTVANGVVYVGSLDHKVYAFSVAGTLNEDAAAKARTLLGAPYGYGGKGYDFLNSLYVDAPTISSGYNYYLSDCTLDKFLGLNFSTGVDCSGLVMWSYNTAYGATTQFQDHNPVIYEGSDAQYYNNFQTDVNYSDLKPGDLLFFHYEPKKVDQQGLPLADHVAMYVGGDDVLEAYTCSSKYPHGNYVIRSSITTRSTLDPITGQTLQPSCIPNPQTSCFLGYRRLTAPQVQLGVHTHSPVTLSVTDPDGYTIDSNTFEFTDREVLREIPRILYYAEDTNNDDAVISPLLKSGNYLIKVFPKPGVQPTDTYSLSVEASGTTVTLATDVPISAIPPEGYGIKSQGGGVGAFTPVQVDIKPGNSKNKINRRSVGKVAVAILSGRSFDAGSIARTSLTFGRTGSEQSLATCNRRLKDINGDGLPDLLCHFYISLTGFQIGDKVGVLQGYTNGGIQVEGEDSVLIVGR